MVKMVLTVVEETLKRIYIYVKRYKRIHKISSKIQLCDNPEHGSEHGKCSEFEITSVDQKLLKYLHVQADNYLISWNKLSCGSIPAH